MLLAFGLQLPAVPPAAASIGQTVPGPPPVTRTADTPGAWAPAWSRDIDATDDLELAVAHDVVVTAGPTSPIEARSLATGDVLWRHALPSWQALSASGPYVLGVSGDHTYALDAATGRTRWVTETTGPATRLVTDGSQVLMVSDTDLLLRDLGTGTGLWHVGLASPPSAPAALGAGLVVVAQQNGAILALDRMAPGAPRWQTTLGGAARGVAVAPPMVYVALASGAFCALDDRNGRERWCFPLRVPATDVPVIDGDHVRVALLDNSLRSFHRHNGSMAPPLALGARPASGPWLTQTSLVVAVTTGEFVIVDRRTGRIATRLTVPEAASSHLLERAAIDRDGPAIASLTLAPGGRRRLTAYRPRPAGQWPILAPPLVLPALPVTLPLPAP